MKNIAVDDFGDVSDEEEPMDKTTDQNDMKTDDNDNDNDAPSNGDDEKIVDKRNAAVALQAEPTTNSTTATTTTTTTTTTIATKSDDEPGSSQSLRKTIQSVADEARQLFADADEAYGDIDVVRFWFRFYHIDSFSLITEHQVREKFEEWRYVHPDDYRRAFVGLSLPKGNN
jgi:hypothetical protein